MAGNSGINRLARVLHKRMKETNKNYDQLELGTILQDMSLKTDLFPIPINKENYLLSRSLTFKNSDPLTNTTTELDHSHNVNLPDKMNPLNQGDRVLVAWVNKGSVPIIVDIVVSS